MFSQQTFEKEVNEACAKLYENRKHFIDEEAHERTLVADFIAPDLRQAFPEWDINTEYNREGEDRDSKRDLDEKLLIPDLIIHKHGDKGPNAVAMQVKGYWNAESRVEDENKLRKLRAKHGYELLYRLELERDRWRLIKIA